MYPAYRKFLLLFCILVIIIYSRFVLAAAAKHLKSNEVNAYKSPYSGTSWIKKMKELRNGVKDCTKFTKQSTWNCFKLTTLRMFDNLMTEKEIPIWNGIRFMRMVNVSTTSNSYQHMNYVNHNMEECKGSVDIEQQTNYDLHSSQERQMAENITWFDQLARRLATTMCTHILEINPKQLADAYMLAGDENALTDLQNADQHGTARHRRHRYNMIITMMFGVTALGAVLVPMGFQLLSVISGKALLLAKMALLLASINGLKRVANSGVHYGLYQVPGEHYGGGYYDRTDVHHPRFTMAQPIDMGI